MTSQTSADPHVHDVEEVLDRLDTTSQGLASDEAERRLAEHGPNKLPEPAKDGVLRRILRHLNDVLIYTLIIAAGITALLQHWIDTAVILLVVVINTAIGFIQEGRAEKALEGIRDLLSAEASVRRDGDWHDVPAEELVVGDVVRVGSGDQVPADLRLLQTKGLRIDEAALTGESVPADKDTEAAGDDAGIGDRTGSAHSGTIVVAGRGVGVVVSTGADTEVGKINRMIGEVEAIETPLTRQMNAFGKKLSLVIVVSALLLFVFAWVVHDYGLGELGLASISLAVSAIPEGLPAILTITLARGVQIMAKRNAITRKLPSVETLGSVTTICSDKTGTLTSNEMTVRRVVTADGDYEVDGTGYAAEGTIREGEDRVEPGERDDLMRLVEVMAVANDSDVVEGDDGWTVRGEATEGALVAFAGKAGFDRDGYSRLDAIPFESSNKFMATLDDTPGGDRRILLKGAPDQVLEFCRSQWSDGGAVDLDREHWAGMIDELGAEGLRVLAAAYRDAQNTESIEVDDLDDEFVLVGIVGLLDPPRPEAIDAIEKCHSAGITVRMITGDHAVTASAIAREMGLGDAPAVTGREIEEADDDALVELARDHVVFARTSPEHKYRLVQALQTDRQVVAMTGDGVNDAPALKQADVGVAMGITGTEATKEAAEVVLADDNFASIERAVEEGRTIYDNLRKSIGFILPTNGGEALVVVVAVLLGWTLPLTAVQILWVNMVTAVTLSLALAYEPAEGDVMQRPPRDVGASILDRFMLGRILLVSVVLGASTLVLFRVARDAGADLDVARTLSVNALVLSECFYLLSARFLRGPALRPSTLFTNKVVWGALVTTVILQLLFVYAPFMHTAFGSAPLTAEHWAWTAGIGVLVLVVVELEKVLLRRRDAKIAASASTEASGQSRGG